MTLLYHPPLPVRVEDSSNLRAQLTPAILRAMVCGIVRITYTKNLHSVTDPTCTCPHRLFSVLILDQVTFIRGQCCLGNLEQCRVFRRHHRRLHPALPRARPANGPQVPRRDPSQRKDKQRVKFPLRAFLLAQKLLEGHQRLRVEPSSGP